tara:strand:- start:1204 stop:1404 length:201 start_codon:yes stop_codon:yes gene_type:complete
MKLGDLIQIKSFKKQIMGLVLSEPNEKTEYWTVILDACGNIVWWPPDDLITLNSSANTHQEGKIDD